MSTTRLKVGNYGSNQSAARKKSQIWEVWLQGTDDHYRPFQLSLSPADRWVLRTCTHYLFDLSSPELQAWQSRHFPRTWGGMGGGERKKAAPVALVTDSLLPKLSTSSQLNCIPFVNTVCPLRRRDTHTHAILLRFTAQTRVQTDFSPSVHRAVTVHEGRSYTSNRYDTLIPCKIPNMKRVRKVLLQ